jgi:DNA-binding XRE family transcriptional regulator
MSAHTKKPHTNNLIEIIVQGTTQQKFILPRKVSPILLAFLRSLQIKQKENILVPANEVFKTLNKKYGKIGTTIRGLRAREELTQTELAKKLNIHQAHVSQIENGKRAIGKKLAKKLAKVFNTDYRLFL